MAKRKTKNKFKQGDKVYSTITNSLLTIESYDWNGLTWMYSFEKTDLRCGEDYLRRETNVEAAFRVFIPKD